MTLCALLVHYTHNHTQAADNETSELYGCRLLWAHASNRKKRHQKIDGDGYGCSRPMPNNRLIP